MLILKFDLTKFVNISFIRKLVALLKLCCQELVYLQSVTVAIPDQTHLLYDSKCKVQSLSHTSQHRLG